MRPGLGRSVAIDCALELGLDEIEARCGTLATGLCEGLAAIRGLTIGELGRNPSASVSFTLEGIPAESMVKIATARGITIGLSPPASTRLDAEARSLPAVARASAHYHNTEMEIDRLVACVSDMILE
jgi:cysteine desulfurase/selenocysteine lyase